MFTARSCFVSKCMTKSVVQKSFIYYKYKAICSMRKLISHWDLNGAAHTPFGFHNKGWFFSFFWWRLLCPLKLRVSETCFEQSKLAQPCDCITKDIWALHRFFANSRKLAQMGQSFPPLSWAYLNPCHLWLQPLVATMHHCSFTDGEADGPTIGQLFACTSVLRQVSSLHSLLSSKTDTFYGCVLLTSRLCPILFTFIKVF